MGEELKRMQADLENLWRRVRSLEESRADKEWIVVEVFGQKKKLRFRLDYDKSNLMATLANEHMLKGNHDHPGNWTVRKENGEEIEGCYLSLARAGVRSGDTLVITHYSEEKKEDDEQGH